MSDEHKDPGSAPPGNIFGKLPDSRPGTRSPRRRTTGADRAEGELAKGGKARRKPAKAPAARPASAKPHGSGAAARAKTAERAKPAGRTAAVPGSDRGGAESPSADRETTQRGPAGLEDLAWAGVATAAEAAAIGVRLASRAIDALRGSTERR